MAAILAQDPSAEAEESIRARCEQATALLASDKAKEASALLDPLLKEAPLGKSRHRALAHYLAGCAAVAQGNDSRAGRVLSMLAPFDQPRIGTHARYLLARIHHRAGEYTEAAALYNSIPAAFEKDLAAAKQALQNPKALSEPDRIRLDTLVKTAPAEFVTETAFYSGLLLYEQKKFADALPKFAQFKDRRPVWVEEARLRQAMCHVQLGQTAEAVKTLHPLLDHARLGRQARWWAAQAFLRSAEPKPAEAAEHLKRTAAVAESEGGPAQMDVLMALGGALDRSGKPAEAVAIYKQLIAGPRGEEALARLAGAHAAAKQNREAEEACTRFEKQYPTSPFLGEVLLRRADAAFAEAQATGARDSEKAKPMYAEAIKQYERCLAQGGSANAARYRMGLAQFRVGKPAEAIATLRGIPDAERSGDLAGASYLLAESILLTSPAPETATDGVAAAALLKNLQEAAEQLLKYAPQAGAQAPEITMKVGQVLQQIAILLAPGEERVRVATQARELYENFRAAYPQHPLRSVAEYERANAFVLAGDPASGVSKLERFRAEPFVKTPVAPLALLRYGQLLRSMGQAPQAAVILAECRTRHEAALLKDAARASWVPLLRYHHAAALKEAKQNAEAIAILESVVKDHAGSEWAESSRRLLREMKP